tara:strand:- start:244 stop:531 length:288 start_codon:yes stop_codon:yes gene_type:complete
MIRYLDAIVAINPDAKVIIKNEDLEQIRWLEGTTPISKEDIETKYNELQTAYDNDYARKRKEEYPSLEDCIHAILDDDLDNLQELRQAVKEKYPK